MSREPIRVKDGERITLATSDGPVGVIPMTTDKGYVLLLFDTPPGVKPLARPPRQGVIAN